MRYAIAPMGLTVLGVVCLGCSCSKEVEAVSFEQDGTFRSVHGQEGIVNFPHPYASPPNVMLEPLEREGPPSMREFFDAEVANSTVIVECTVTGFRWRNACANLSAHLRWTARGIRGKMPPK
jgi:hypothetical protein